MAGVGESYFGLESTQPIATLPIAELAVTSDNTRLNFYDTQRKRCQKFAESFIQDDAKPVETLVSAGSTTITPKVAASRRGFQDFRRMQILVQWWKISGDTAYRDHAMKMILDWADLNVPDGHPINQTHWEGLHIVLEDLAPQGTAGEFTTSDYNTRLKPWLQAIRTATENWPFPPEPGGGTLIFGNHFTHHYMQLLLCLQSLGDTSAFNALLSIIDDHATENFPFGNSAVDYPENFSIVTINQGSQYFEINVDKSSNFVNGIQFNITGSTGNDGTYTCNGASTFTGGNTRIFVNESIPSSVTDGTLNEEYQPSVHWMPRAATDIGESIDFIRRDSNHYQVYDIQPWLNIAIAEGGTRYETLMDNGFNFMWERMLDPLNIHFEFTNSVDDFDELRYLGSRAEYLQPNSLWLPDEGGRVTMNYYRYKLGLNPLNTVNDAYLALAQKGDRISTDWPYWIRFTLGV